MPELPEVETIAQSLAPQIAQRLIVAVEKLDWERMVETPDVRAFLQTLEGRRVARVGRRAKWLLFALDAGWTLALHLRMSGRLCVYDAAPPADQHTHLVLALDNGQRLFFRDPRKFGRVRLLDGAGVAALDAQYGPEPLDDQFQAHDLAQRLARRRTRLKPLLLEQAFIAGLGNIYVDESLWLARLHPLRAAHTLTPEEATRLYQAIRTVLQQAIASGGSTLRDYRNGYGDVGHTQEYFSVYGRKGKPCPRCGATVARVVVAQRGTHLCPICQPSEGCATGAPALVDN